MFLIRMKLYLDYRYSSQKSGFEGPLDWDLCVGLLYEHRFAMLIKMNSFLKFLLVFFIESKSFIIIPFKYIDNFFQVPSMILNFQEEEEKGIFFSQRL